MKKLMHYALALVVFSALNLSAAVETRGQAQRRLARERSELLDQLFDSSSSTEPSASSVNQDNPAKSWSSFSLPSFSLANSWRKAAVLAGGGSSVAAAAAFALWKVTASAAVTAPWWKVW